MEIPAKTRKLLSWFVAALFAVAGILALMANNYPRGLFLLVLGVFFLFIFGYRKPT